MRLDFDDDSDDSEEKSIKAAKKSKRVKVEKDIDDSVPLPSPFPLPKHYPHNVENALKMKKMTKEAMCKFVSVIAGAMLNYKRYPTSQDYYNVAQSVITSFPYLKSPTGSPHVCVSMYLLIINFCVGSNCLYVAKSIQGI